MRISYTALKVLKVCSDHPRQRLYGYDLMQTTGLASGTLYPILLRFEKEGWLTSTWEELDSSLQGRPRRRLYRITGAGRRALWEHLGDLGVVTG